jgi:prepilin-type N-terminal cleavage/methylation domain-containing protein
MSADVLRRVGRARDDQGSTITEMLIVMVIMGIIVAATATLTLGLSRTTAQNTARQNQVDVARTAVERMSKTVRSAVKPSQLLSSCAGTCLAASAFTSGTSSSMQFYSNLDNTKDALGNRVGPSRVTYTVPTTGADAGVLVEKVQRPEPGLPDPNTGYTYCNAEAAGASTDCRKRLTVTRYAPGVRTADSAPLFAYYDAEAQRIRPNGAGVITAAELQRVVAVEVTLTVARAGTNASEPTTYIQRITLPNAQALVQEEEDATP